MKDYSSIIQDIKDNITENGKGEITGRDLREILLEAIGNVSVDIGELDRRIEAILGGENYDDIINSWAELEYFLSGLDESSNLAEILSYKADKDQVYSKTDIDTKLEDYTKTDDLGALALKDEVEMSDIKNLEATLDEKLNKAGGEIENNLLVKGELRMGVLFLPTSDGEPSSYRLAIGELGEGADIPSSGEGGLGSVTIMLGDVPYYSDSNGIVRLPAYPTGGGSVEWNAIINKPTTLAGYGITDAISTSGGTIDSTNNVPVIINTSNSTEVVLQLSQNGQLRAIVGYDIYNGSYIQNGINYRFMGIADDGTPYYHNGSYKDTLLHSGNYSDYVLPKSGGTMQGDIVIPMGNYVRVGSAYDTYAMFGHDSSGILVGTPNLPLLLRSDGTSTINGNTLYHSGNFNPASYLPLSGGTIESTSYYPLILDTTQTINNGILFNSNKVIKTQIGWGDGIGTFMLNYGSDCILGIKDDGTPYYLNQSDWVYRTLIHSGNIGNQYVKGLATPVTIWGQSFSGTGNVSGNVVGSNFLIMDRTVNPYIRLTENGLYGYVQFENGSIFIGPTSSSSLLVNQSGNVLIGTTTDSGYKLNVTGGQVRVGAAEATDTSYGKYHGFVTGFHGIDYMDFYEAEFNFYTNGGWDGCLVNVYGNISASGYQLPTSPPSNPVSGGYYLYVGTLGAGATIS